MWDLGHITPTSIKILRLDDKFNRQFNWLKNELFKLDLASQK